MQLNGVDLQTSREVKLAIVDDVLVVTTQGADLHVRFGDLGSVEVLELDRGPICRIRGAVELDVLSSDLDAVAAFTASMKAALENVPVAEDLANYVPPPLPNQPAASFPPRQTTNISAPPPSSASAVSMPPPPVATPGIVGGDASSGVSAPGAALLDRLLGRPALLSNLMSGLFAASMFSLVVGGPWVVMRTFDVDSYGVDALDRLVRFAGGFIVVSTLVVAFLLLAIAVRLVSAAQVDDLCLRQPLLGPVASMLRYSERVANRALILAVILGGGAFLVSLLTARNGIGSFAIWVGFGLASALTITVLAVVVDHLRASLPPSIKDLHV